MITLDPWHIHETSRTSQQRPTRERQFRDRLPATFGDCTCAVSDPFAALQHVGDNRMMLEALEFHVRKQMRVFVVQMDHKADINLIVLKMVNERPATGIATQGPTHSVGYLPFLVVLRLDFPDLLHAQTIFLNIRPSLQIIFLNHLLGKAAAHPFGQENILAVKHHPGLITRPLGAIGVHTELARNNAFNLAIVTVNQLRARHAGENLYAHLFSLLCHPAAHIRHRDNVIAVVVHQRRHREVRNTDGTTLPQHQETIFSHLGLDRRPALFPVRHQSIQPDGIQNRTRKDMRPNFGALFKHHNIQICIKLFQPDRCRKARWPRAYNNNVVIHRLAFNIRHADYPLVHISVAQFLPRSRFAGQSRHDINGA